VLKPEHVRHTDVFVRRYGVRAYGPDRFDRHDIPATDTPWHHQRALPALRALLELPFEHVIVSHGEPLHTRADLEHALERTSWREP
jgi:hypothetical protein